MSTRKKIPTHALVVVRTRPDGSTTRHEVARAEAPDREALAAAVAADPLLHEVRRGEIVEVTVDEAVARPVEMLAMLRAVGPKTAEDPSEWGEDVAEPWVETDDSGFEDAYGFDVVPRWVSVNGQRATGVLDETSTRRRLHLVLLGVDGWTVVPLSSVMESWYSDDGGSRVSGAGSRALVLLTPSLALQVAEGDYTDPTGILSWPSKRRARAELVVRWIQGIEAETAAALSLEPLDTTPSRPRRPRSGKSCWSRPVSGSRWRAISGSSTTCAPRWTSRTAATERCERRWLLPRGGAGERWRLAWMPWPTASALWSTCSTAAGRRSRLALLPAPRATTRRSGTTASTWTRCAPVGCSDRPGPPGVSFGRDAPRYNASWHVGGTL